MERIFDLPLLLVGPGRAGRALARSWRKAGGVLAGVAGRTPESARQAGEALSARAFGVSEIPARVELLVLAVPDDQIAEVSRGLAVRTRCRLVFHLSGALSASALAPLRATGASAASVHPLRAFAGDPEDDWDGALVALEGDAEATTAAEQMVAAFGGDAYRIEAVAKPLYHAAATLAAGGTMAVLSVAVRAAVAAGLPESRARAALARLASEAAAAAAKRPFRDAFTGPVARRDAETVRAHRAAAAAHGDFLDLYRELARETLAATAGRGKEEEILAILEYREPRTPTDRRVNKPR
ncbi:MAG TPA: DUF2520 domain-containing protein [Thermoanaerobaculia bacterium]|nr:DUF2520 domain-containing protein [Thermoanaerobaculia bacterium]